MEYGQDYIIPTPFDPRLIHTIPPAVAQAAMDTGVARRPIKNMNEYKKELAGRLNPTANTMNSIYDTVRNNPQTVVYAEGEEEKVVRAAFQWRDQGYGQAKLVGREERVKDTIKRLGFKDMEGIEIVNAAISKNVDKYINSLYRKLQRKGVLYRDCVRMVKNDRNIFASCILANGDADTMVTGLTRNYYDTLEDVQKVFDRKDKDKPIFAISLCIAKNKKSVFIADTAVNGLPSPEELAQIAIESANKAHQFGHEPRVALLSFSNFGKPMHSKSERARQAIEELDKAKVNFEYDGEMAADVALEPELMKLYPFCRLSGPANVLIMPSLNASNISAKLLEELGGGMLIGPIIIGLEKPVQIVDMGATVSEIMNMTALAAIDAINEKDSTKKKR
jgi:malate dehydrogenase (oxaloacetate-decarboxylating)(NADP+)